MRPLYIFDIDGTLALAEHRQLLVRKSPPDWPGFFALCPFDEPNKPVVDTLAILSYGCDIKFFSGRSDEVRQQTIDWLAEHTCFKNKAWIDSALTMRPAKNTEPDDVVKLRWLDALSIEDRARLVAVFDDRQKVVDMWRKAGVACFQVRPSFD